MRGAQTQESSTLFLHGFGDGPGFSSCDVRKPTLGIWFLEGDVSDLQAWLENLAPFHLYSFVLYLFICSKAFSSAA